MGRMSTAIRKNPCRIKAQGWRIVRARFCNTTGPIRTEDGKICHTVNSYLDMIALSAMPRISTESQIRRLPRLAQLTCAYTLKYLHESCVSQSQSDKSANFDRTGPKEPNTLSTAINRIL